MTKLSVRKCRELNVFTRIFSPKRFFFLLFLLVPFVFLVTNLVGKDAAYQFFFSIPTSIISHPHTLSDASVPTVIPDVSDNFLAEAQKKTAIVYYVRFNRKGSKYRTELVKVSRSSGTSVRSKVMTVLKALIKGPEMEETEDGLFTTIPKDLKVHKRFKLKNNILHISFTDTLLSGAGTEIIRHRLHQVSHSLLSIEGITGVCIYVNHQKIESILGSEISLPKVVNRSSISAL